MRVAKGENTQKLRLYAGSSVSSKRGVFVAGSSIVFDPLEPTAPGWAHARGRRSLPLLG
jgi:hypothetical protein